MTTHTKQPADVGAILLVFLLALIPRALAGHFLTVDEAYHWYGRVESFAAALASGDYVGTNLIGHPGVTTMWLGSMGLWLHQALAAVGWLNPGDADLYRALIRAPLAATAALGVALALPLLARLVGRTVALLAVLLWAGEPFLVAHGQLLHLDSLLATFMALSLLVLLCGLPKPHPANAPMHWGWLLLSGVCGGLALLTKSPSLALLPVTGLTLLAACYGRDRRWLPAAGAATLHMLVWLVAALLTWVLLWPAAWVDLPGAAGRVFLQAQADGGSPHGWGNFFLGQAVADPGPLFYPVAIVLRLSPWTLIGVLAFVVGLRSRLRSSERLVWWALAGLVVLFVLMMSIPPKKFDRYALPTFPVFCIMAAAGWNGLWHHARLAVLRVHLGRVGRLWPLLVTLVLAINLAWLYPYPLAYFNPLFGGGPFAARIIPVGWGEGYEQAGAWIAAQPNGADRPVAALYGPVLAAYVPAGAAPMEWAYQPGAVDYAVLYIDQIQRGFKADLVTPLFGQVTPVHTVVINNIEYAYVYQIAPPVGQPRVAQFGDAIQLRGYALATDQIRTAGVLTVTLQWQGLATPASDAWLFVHVLNAGGQRVAGVDVPPDPRWPTSQWARGRYTTTVQQVPLPADLAVGTYRVVIGLYDQQTFVRLPLITEAGMLAPDDGEHALLVTTFTR